MFGASYRAGYSCGADANSFIERWFGDCVYTPWETVAFCVGLSSVFFWVIAQLPQFISNFVRKSADALSPWFLFQWLAGDSFNFLGCVLTGDQLVTQTITAGYFVFSDIIIIIQYLYYQVRNGNVLDVDYSDFDESMHKGVGYSDVQNSDTSRSSALENILEQSAHAKAAGERTSLANQRHYNSIQHQVDVSRFALSECERPQVSAFVPNNLVRKTNDLNEYIQSSHPFCKGNLNSNTQSIAGSTSGATGQLGQLNQVNRTPKSSDGVCSQQAHFPLSVSDLKQQNSWMYEHRHRLRRLVQVYGLEYGHGTVTHFRSLYKSKHKDRYGNNQPSFSRRGSENAPVPSRKAGVKALLGVACFFGLVSTTKPGVVSSVSGMSGPKLGSILGRRALLALPEVAATVTEINQPAVVYVGGQLLSLSNPAFSWTRMLGRLLGWGSSALYLGSRLSQLVKNKQRRSAEGLSLGMVTCAVLANLTYGTSIIMRTPSWENLIGKAPWLLGSFGTVFLDFSIFVQAHYYSWHSKKGTPSEYTPLLA